MTRSRLSLNIVSTIFVVVFVLVSVLAGGAQRVWADTPVDGDGGPTVPYPVGATYSKFPNYLFFAVPFAEKYRVKVYDTRPEPDVLVYILTGRPGICSGGICTLSAPVDIPLKQVDLSDQKGYYRWTMEAKVYGEWSMDPSVNNFQVYAGNYSTDFTSLKKWRPTYGVWSVLLPETLTVKPPQGQYASLTYKNKVTSAYVFEVTMKRNAKESEAGNFIIVKGQPDLSLSEDGWGKGIMFSYDNAGNCRVDRWTSNSLTTIVDEFYGCNVRSGNWNTLTAFVYFGFVHFYMNGVEVIPPIKDSDDYGWVGIGAYEDDSIRNALLVDSASVRYTTIEPYAP